jgi:hypothetical protein
MSSELVREESEMIDRKEIQMIDGEEIQMIGWRSILRGLAALPRLGTAAALLLATAATAQQGPGGAPPPPDRAAADPERVFRILLRDKRPVDFLRERTPGT